MLCQKEGKGRKRPSKGDKVCFICGSYEEPNGWLDTANKCKKKSKFIWVVVNNKDYEEEIHAKVWKILVRKRQKAPTTWAEAAVQQHPELEDAVIEVAQLFASCLITDEKSVIELIGNEIRLAQKENISMTKQTV